MRICLNNPAGPLRACIVLFSILLSGNASARPACPSELVDKMLATAQGEPASFPLACDLTLPKQSLVRGNLILEGASASGVTVDCNGSTIDASAGRDSALRTAITVRSRQTADGTWDVPHNVTVRNCTIRGSVRLYGLEQNTNGPVMRDSSFRQDHTTHAQESAPRDNAFLDMRITAHDAVALYVGAGVRKTTLANSTIDGDGPATAIYLDAESSGNVIENNLFRFESSRREVLAIDGSSRNVIVGNTFQHVGHGGIFIYRNCGEGGVIRHQKPEYNTIEGNTFDLSNDADDRKSPTIWLGSRQGRQSFCFVDPAHPFGSSLSPMDFAQHNSVDQNVFVGGSKAAIRDSDAYNSVDRNTFR